MCHRKCRRGMSASIRRVKISKCLYSILFIDKCSDTVIYVWWHWWSILVLWCNDDVYSLHWYLMYFIIDTIALLLRYDVLWKCDDTWWWWWYNAWWFDEVTDMMTVCCDLWPSDDDMMVMMMMLMICCSGMRKFAAAWLLMISALLLPGKRIHMIFYSFAVMMIVLKLFWYIWYSTWNNDALLWKFVHVVTVMMMLLHLFYWNYIYTICDDILIFGGVVIVEKGIHSMILLMYLLLILLMQLMLFDYVCISLLLLHCDDGDTLILLMPTVDALRYIRWFWYTGVLMMMEDCCSTIDDDDIVF